MVSWREQPTRYDIEALQANTRRVGLVIKVRWALVLVLASYSIIGAWIYAQALPLGELTDLMIVPAAALLFVMLYNTFYLLTYKRLGNIAFLNHLQFFFDALVVSVLVYYSGGASSWFWTMYPLFVFEAAFILPRARDTWLLAGGIALLHGLVLWGMYFGVLPPGPRPLRQRDAARERHVRGRALPVAGDGDSRLGCGRHAHGGLAWRPRTRARERVDRR